jgi:hypothetical protein
VVLPQVTCAQTACRLRQTDQPRLARLWLTGIGLPRTSLRGFPDDGGPRLGTTAVLVRFIVTDLMETLPLTWAGVAASAAYVCLASRLVR